MKILLKTLVTGPVACNVVVALVKGGSETYK